MEPSRTAVALPGTTRRGEIGGGDAWRGRVLRTVVDLGYDAAFMGSAVQLEDNEVTLLGRALDAGHGRLSAAAARAFLQAEFPPADHARMEALGAKARAGTLQPDEKELLDRYVRASHLLTLLKSKARRSLNPAKGSGG